MAGIKGQVGSGGQRIGSGPKPKTRNVLAFQAAREPVTMPDEVTEDGAVYWARWAPLATSAGTLTDQTIPAFVELCEAQARVSRWWRRVEQDGETFEKVTIDGAGQEQRETKAHPLIAKAQTQAHRVEMLLARFSLAPNGKPVNVIETKPASKWANYLAT